MVENCEVCHKKANYSCPNCGAKYCSSGCYKLHSKQCVEKFSKNLLKDMPAPKVSSETIIATQKILRDSEQNAQNMLNYEEVEPWKAWWEDKLIKNPPQPIFPPPENVSPLLPYHLVDILYSYCYVLRLYNGDTSFDINGVIEAMLTISDVIEGTPNLDSVKKSLSSCIENTRKSELFVEYQWQVEVVHDVELVLQSKEHISKALYEMFMLFSSSKHKKATKKLQFFFAWAPSINKKVLENLAEEVHEYYTSLTAYLVDVHAKEFSLT